MKHHLIRLSDRILQESGYSKDKSDNFGEVFTPPELINEMLDKLPEDVWRDKTKTFFDPCAGKGNFPIQIIKRLFKGLEDQIINEEERIKNIVENQIFMAELQDNSAEFIREHFQFGMGLKVNLYHGNSLNMPEDYFGGSVRTEGYQFDLFYQEQMKSFK